MRSWSVPPDSRLSGLGLECREWTDNDLAAMQRLFDDEAVAGWRPLVSQFDDQAALDYLASARERRHRDGRIQLVIIEGAEPLGEILLFKDRLSDNGAEIGYAVGPRHRGRGVATRAVRLMTDYAYETLHPDRVVLRIEPANEASAAVARKAGFHHTSEAPIVL